MFIQQPYAVIYEKLANHYVEAARKKHFASASSIKI